MIDKNLVAEAVNEFLSESPLFLVDVKVTPDNNVTVTVDSPEGVDIDQCVALSRKIEERFDRDVEDYELEVGSAGLTAPFTVPAQYNMNVGNDVELLTRSGLKLRGVLEEVNADCSQIVVAVPTKVKNEGEKRPHIENIPQTIAVADIKKIVRDIKF
ncbi:MAG: ribosome assembly cofactor RimP [Muribaculaceae bacterium]